MDTTKALVMGQANRHRSQMVFDWNKAARLIREAGAKDASAGLASDWEYTGGAIFADGKPIKREDTYVYLASTWATPELDIDGDVRHCYVMEADVPKEWGDDYAHIYWPASAVAILEGRA